MRWIRSLYNWLRRKPGPREIFAFHDGDRRRWVDPMAVHQVLDGKGSNWQGLLAELSVEHAMDGAELSPGLQAEMGKAPQIVSELAGLVRAAFGVKALGTRADGRPEGLTDLECLDLLTDYLVWLREVEFDALPLSSSPKSGPPSPSASSEDTGEWLASGSPATASA